MSCAQHHCRLRPILITEKLRVALQLLAVKPLRCHLEAPLGDEVPGRKCPSTEDGRPGGQEDNPWPAHVESQALGACLEVENLQLALSQAPSRLIPGQGIPAQPPEAGRWYARRRQGAESVESLFDFVQACRIHKYSKNMPQIKPKTCSSCHPSNVRHSYRRSEIRRPRPTCPTGILQLGSIMVKALSYRFTLCAAEDTDSKWREPSSLSIPWLWKSLTSKHQQQQRQF